MGSDASCIDCLQTFRNGFYHKHLDRKLASQKLMAWGERLSLSHDIPAVQPSQAPGDGSYPVNEAERRLRYLLLAAGFEEGTRGEQLQLDRAIGSTTPDVIYRAPHHDADEGVCIYLDGLSGHLHGDPATAAKDAQIRTWLRNNGYEVIEIAASELSDQGAMTRYFRRLAGYLNDVDLRQRLRSDTRWFNGQVEPAPAPEQALLRIVDPAPADRYVNCLPLIPLKAAAGLFSDPQLVPDDSEWEQWVVVEAGRKLRRGMFVAQVVGRSMEPRIPDGSYCLFSSPVEGSRQGKIVLVQLRNKADPESGGRYTVKRYESEKSLKDDTWRHLKITLKPLNPEFEPIVLATEDEESIVVIAEFLQAL